jgi:aryl-alcohol dehydrogenase-like predicted oxidoreductase
MYYGLGMQKRKLGRNGPEVGALGLGCMGMSAFYGPRDDEESISTIHRALERGVTLLDTSDMYGPHTNERLVGRAIKGKRDQAVLATIDSIAPPGAAVGARYTAPGMTTVHR